MKLETCDKFRGYRYRGGVLHRKLAVTLNHINNRIKFSRHGAFAPGHIRSAPTNPSRCFQSFSAILLGGTLGN